MSVPIDPNCEWYEAVMIRVRKENWWMWRGGESDGDGVIGDGDGVVLVECAVCL